MNSSQPAEVSEWDGIALRRKTRNSGFSRRIWDTSHSEICTVSSRTDNRPFQTGVKNQQLEKPPWLERPLSFEDETSAAGFVSVFAKPLPPSTAIIRSNSGKAIYCFLCSLHFAEDFPHMFCRCLVDSTAPLPQHIICVQSELTAFQEVLLSTMRTRSELMCSERCGSLH